jgi:4-amino-4-deoxy-L-arabinose transferase-like glycosyltransferase
MSQRRLLFIFLGALTIFRLVYLTQFELTPDEAYYFQWSQHLDLSYYSKGPGVALAMRLATLVGGDTVFGIRFLSPLLALGTSLLMFGFARRLYGETVAIWTVFTMQLVPIFQAGSLLMTIDPLSVFFWMAALYTFWLALEKSPAFSAWWPVTGVLIGCGFLAKYTNAMQLLSIFLVLVLTAKYRRELHRGGFLSLLLVFALFTTPVIVWNSQHAWITLIHLRARGGLDTGPQFHPLEFLTFLGAHLVVYSPLIFGGFIVCLGWAWKKARAHFKPRFLLAFTLPLFVMYFALSFKKAGPPNWTAPASLSLIILAVPYWLEKAREARWARNYAVTALSIGAVLVVLLTDTDLIRGIGLPLPYEKDPTARLRGWQTAAEQVQKVREKYEAEHGEKVFLIGDEYGTAAALGFYLPDPRRESPGHPPVYVPESAWPTDQFYFWPRYDGMVDYADAARDKLRPSSNLDPALRTELAAALADLPPFGQGTADPQRVRRFLAVLKAAAPELGIDDYFTETMGYNPFIGRSALYVTDRRESEPASVIEKTFAHRELIACFEVYRRGQPLKQIRIFACSNYSMQEL